MIALFAFVYTNMFDNVTKLHLLSVCCATLHCFPATPDELQTPGGTAAGVRGAGEPRPRGLPAVGRRWLGSSRVRQAVLRRVRPQRRIRQL